MVYVINKNGHPLMPCSETKARKLLRAGRAKCKRRTPFTIKLTWDCEENVQEVVAGMDTGSKTIGCAAIANGQVVYQSEVQLREDVSKKMEQRLPTGKLFGLRKFDLIKTKRGIGFVKGKRKSGCFEIFNLCDDRNTLAVGIKKNCTRISARTTTLTERRMAHSATGQAHVVSCA